MELELLPGQFLPLSHLLSSCYVHTCKIRGRLSLELCLCLFRFVRFFSDISLATNQESNFCWVLLQSRPETPLKKPPPPKDRTAVLLEGVVLAELLEGVVLLLLLERVVLDLLERGSEAWSQIGRRFSLLYLLSSVLLRLSAGFPLVGVPPGSWFLAASGNGSLLL